MGMTHLRGNNQLIRCYFADDIVLEEKGHGFQAGWIEV